MNDPAYPHDAAERLLIERWRREMELSIEAMRTFRKVLVDATLSLRTFSEAFDTPTDITISKSGKRPEQELEEIMEGLASPPSPIPTLPSSEGIMCDRCGGMMQRTGSCYTCSSCGESGGCG